MELNPSISGWINKFHQELFDELVSYENEEKYFLSIIQSGLLYGKIKRYHLKIPIDDKLWSEEDKAQFCLFTSALSLYRLRKNINDLPSFLNSFLVFYKEITHYKQSWVEKILPQTKPSSQAEEFIKERIINEGNFLIKTFSHDALNAFLFLEIIYFDYYLENQSIDEALFKSHEKQCLQIIQNAIDVKVVKNSNDELFIKLFKKSSQYNKDEELKYEQYIDYSKYSFLEKMYVLNLCHLVFFKDNFINVIERKFLKDIENQMRIPNAAVIETAFLDYMEKYKQELPYLKIENSVMTAYTKIQDITVKTLLKNKNRLATEISQSKELVQLLLKSQTTKLTKEEKRKVKQQLKDVLKTIPSLAIFLLPGGGLLMPLLIKFIPQMLPSAFNENSNEVK